MCIRAKCNRGLVLSRIYIALFCGANTLCTLNKETQKIFGDPPDTCGPAGLETAKHVPHLLVWELAYVVRFSFDNQETINGMDGMSVVNATEVATAATAQHGGDGMSLFGGDPPLDLGNFLKRPVNIYTGDLTSDVFLNPFQDFLSNAVVAEKLAHFRYVSGTLVVRVTISCARTSYGLARFAIWPGYEDELGAALDWNIYKVSMLPGMWMDIPMTGSAIYRIPYINPLPAIDLLAGTGADFVHAILKRYVAVDSFTGLTDACQARVEAWMEDAQLTQSIPLLGEPQGEYAAGIVSRPATVVANAAAALIPALGPFARATEIGARAVGAIAALFGFSRPLLIADPVMMITDTSWGPGKFVGRKFALDPKQELSLGIGMFGEDTGDPLSIRKIAAHSTLFTIFQWDTTDASNGVLYGCPVTPGLTNLDMSDPGPNMSVYQTPMAEVAHCFQYWRGTIRFNFKVVCHPSYHGGVLRIFWSPERFNYPSSHDVSNTVISALLDLSTGNEITVDVPFQSIQGMLRTSVEYGTLTVGSEQYYNGYIYAQVVNPLRANQVSGPAVPVQVYVSVCAPDLELSHYFTGYTEFMHPVPLLSNTVTAWVRDMNSMIASPANARLEPPRIKGSFEAEVLGKELMSTEKAIPLYMGERCESLRVPLKEPMPIYEIDAPSATGTFMMCGHLFPWIEQGYAIAGPAYVAVGTQANLYSYLHRSFMGWRGGSRWMIDHLNLSGAGSSNFPEKGVWSEHLVDDYLFVRNQTGINGTPTEWARLQQTPKIVGSYNNAAEYPLHSRYLFRPSSRIRETTLKYCSQGFLVTSQTATNSNRTLWWCAAEDFSPVLYLGPRTKWTYWKQAMTIPAAGANRPIPL